MQPVQQPDSVIYNGRSVLKEHFRAFVYGKDGAKKLMNSWADYEKHIQSGTWFDSVQAMEDKQPRKPAKKKQTYNSGTFEVGEKDEGHASMDEPLPTE